MKKMPCLFVREFHGRDAFTITETVTPGCEWVLAGEGEASRKWDGTACAVIGGWLYKRYDAKRGKAPPEGAIPCDEPDPVTGHHPHWVRVGGEPESKWHLLAWMKWLEASGSFGILTGTYELCGPHFSANPEGFPEERFMRHGAEVVPLWERTFAGLRAALEIYPGEGFVFLHPDGRRCKLRRADFGFPWPLSAAAREV